MSRNEWTHSICRDCWFVRSNDKPVKVKPALSYPTEYCCFCGNETGEGIYVRQDPKTAHPPLPDRIQGYIEGYRDGKSS